MPGILEDNQMFYQEWEPKQTHRFMMFINDIPSYIVKATDRPKLQISETEHAHINVTRYVASKGKWDPISVTLYDPIDNSGTQAVMNWVRSCFESATGRMGYSNFYKKEIKLNALGPAGDIVEEWILKGAWITNPDFGALNWEDEGQKVEIILNIRFDYAVLNF